MKWFQIIELHRDDVVCVVKESQMQHCEFITDITFAQQMSRSEKSR